MRESRLENIGLLMEYEEILLKKRKDFTSSYMGKATLQKSACSVFRFAFEDILGWTPEMVRDYTTPELMNILHLRKPLNRIEFPPELDKRTDLFYLACIPMITEIIEYTLSTCLICSKRSFLCLLSNESKYAIIANSLKMLFLYKK